VSPLVTRQMEAAATFFVATFLAIGAGSLTGVDVTDTHAVVTALSLALSGAVLATVKHFVPALTTLSPKGE
jgi:hypothetical protein